MATSGASGVVINLIGRSYYSEVITIYEELPSASDADGTAKDLTGWTNFKSEGKNDDTETASRFIATVTASDLPNGQLLYEVTDTDTGTIQTESLTDPPEPLQGIGDIFGTNPAANPERIIPLRWYLTRAVTTTVE